MHVVRRGYQNKSLNYDFLYALQSLQKKRKKLKKRLRKGVPDSVRGRVWCLLAGVPKSMTEKPNLYNELQSMTDVYDREIYETIER